MSISVDGLIKCKKLQDELFRKYIYSYFIVDNSQDLKYENNYFVYKCDKYTFHIYFSKDRIYPANIWDSDILKKEYEYSNIIMFDLCKGIDYEEAYRCILDFFVFLHEEIQCDILVTSDVFNDICYMTDHKYHWSDQWLNRWEK